MNDLTILSYSELQNRATQLTRELGLHELWCEAKDRPEYVKEWWNIRQHELQELARWEFVRMANDAIKVRLLDRGSSRYDCPWILFTNKTALNIEAVLFVITFASYHQATTSHPKWSRWLVGPDGMIGIGDQLDRRPYELSKLESSLVRYYVADSWPAAHEVTE
jgi:hypothetical protein